jgi:hypothetical protein
MLRWFRLQNGVQKRTYSRRFDDFDRLSLAAIAANFSVGQAIRVHDVGASDGRTSCDLYHHLNHRYGERLDFLASDYAPYLYVLKRARRTSRLIVDDQQNILQIITPPFVFIVFHTESRRLHPLDYLLRLLVTGLYARPLLEDYKAGRPGIERIKLELLCSECRVLTSRQTNFRFDSYDVVLGPREHFDIIRTMNILNYDYLSEAQLRKAVENIIRSLSEGGLFITGSNMEQGSIVDGAIYKKTKNHMERVEISGKGSKVESLISDVAVSTDETISSHVGSGAAQHRDGALLG